MKSLKIGHILYTVKFVIKALWRLNKFRVKYDLRKYYFTSRVVNVWNCLSSFVVSADSVNCFKNRLDNF